MRIMVLTGAALLAAGSVHAQVKVGIVDSLSGPVASIGVPYDKGYKAWEAGPMDAGGQKLIITEIDDASDPAVAARAAKKLVEEDPVDARHGPAGTPASNAVYGVAYEAKVPMIVPGNSFIPGERGAW